MAERLKVLMGIESNIKSKRRQRKTGKKEKKMFEHPTYLHHVGLLIVMMKMDL